MQRPCSIVPNYYILNRLAHGTDINTQNPSRSRDGCKLRAKSWEMVRSRIGIKIEGAVEIYCISARAPPTMKWHQTIRTNQRPKAKGETGSSVEDRGLQGVAPCCTTQRSECVVGHACCACHTSSMCMNDRVHCTWSASPIREGYCPNFYVSLDSMLSSRLNYAVNEICQAIILRQCLESPEFSVFRQNSIKFCT